MKPAIPILPWLALAACAGEFTPLDITGPVFSGRAVDARGAPVAEVSVYLVQDADAIRAVRTGPDGAFTLPAPAPGPYRVVLHDGAGVGHLVAARVEGFTALGELPLRSLRAWPEAVTLRGIGYAERQTEAPGGLEWVYPQSLDTPPLWVQPDGAGGRAGLFTVGPEGEVARISDDAADLGRIEASWLSVAPSPEGALTLYRLGDGARLHVLEPRPLEIEIDEGGAVYLAPVRVDERTVDWRGVRVTPDGAVAEGPSLFDGAGPERLCARTFEGRRFFAPDPEPGGCATEDLRIFDPETLTARPPRSAERPPPQPGRGFVHDGRTYVLQLDEPIRLQIWDAAAGTLSDLDWFRCEPECAGELVGLFARSGLVGLQFADDAGRPSFRISDLDARTHRWVGARHEVDGEIFELLFEPTGSLPTLDLDADGAPRVVGNVVGDAGEQTLVVTAADQASTAAAALVPLRSCPFPLSVSPRGRWEVFLADRGGSGCAPHVRPAGAAWSELRSLDFLVGTGRLHFVRDDRAVVFDAIDPLTGARQLFAVALDGGAR